MKPGKPLARKTRLKQGKPITRKTAMVAKPRPAAARSTLPKPTQPITPVSDKRKAKNVERREVLKDMTGGEPVLCERCRRRWANDGHEVLSRGRGGDIADRAIIALVCRICHDWIGQHPTEATATGWMTSAGPRPRIQRYNTGGTAA